MQVNVDLKSILMYNKSPHEKRRDGMQDSIIFKGNVNPKDYIQYLGQSSFIVSTHEVAMPFIVKKVDGTWAAEENEMIKGGELQSANLIQKLEEIINLTSFNAFEGLYSPHSNSMEFKLENGALVEIKSQNFNKDSIVKLFVTIGDQKTKVFAFNEEGDHLNWGEVCGTPYALKEFVDGEATEIPPEALDILSNIITEAAPYILAVERFNNELDELNYTEDYEEW